MLNPGARVLMISQDFAASYHPRGKDTYRL